MKGNFLLSLALLAAAVSSVSADSITYRKKVLSTNNLIGYWPWESSYIDLTANANDARVAGNAGAVTFCPGVNGGQALQIDNTTPGQFVEVPAPLGSVFDAPFISVVTWVRITKAAAPGERADWNAAIERNSLWYIDMESMEDRGGKLGLDFVVRLYSPLTPGKGGDLVRDPKFFFRENEWHQLAFTYDGNTLVTYLDGKEALRRDQPQGVAPSAATPKDPPHANYNISWGAWQQRGDWFTGCIDDTAIFSRALTGDEIKALFDAMMKPQPGAAQ